jgi:hypothetical protein
MMARTLHKAQLGTGTLSKKGKETMDRFTTKSRYLKEESQRKTNGCLYGLVEVSRFSFIQVEGGTP